MSPKKLDLTNCILILRSCAQRPRTAQELQRSAGMSRSTFYRTLIDLREQLKTCINCEDGRYAVADWGILNRRRVGIPRGTAHPEGRAQACVMHEAQVNQNPKIL